LMSHVAYECLITWLGASLCLRFVCVSFLVGTTGTVMFYLFCFFPILFVVWWARGCAVFDCADNEEVMLNRNEVCPIAISHVPQEWVMPHSNETCNLKMSHVT
jgi:hypothetical protein